jgi:prepilin-type N-terminal cleavage/methylation domain-containing protein
MQSPTFRIRQHSSSDSQRPVTKRCGFTLLELVLVVGLLLVVTAVALPGIAGWQARLPLDRAVAAIQHTCLEARVLAIQTGTTHVVQLSEQKSEVYMFPTGVIENQGEQPKFPPGQDIATFDFLDSEGHNLTRLLFYPDGTSSSAQIAVTDENEHQTLLILDRLTGMVGLKESSINHNGSER